MKEDLILTSAKVPSELFEEFKVDCVRYKFTIKKLLERSMYLYLTDEEFKKRLHSILDVTLKK